MKGNVMIGNDGPLNDGWTIMFSFTSYLRIAAVCSKDIERKRYRIQERESEGGRLVAVIAKNKLSEGVIVILNLF